MPESLIEKLWRDAGLPEYFLGNGGTNHKLYKFVELIRQHQAELATDTHVGYKNEQPQGDLIVTIERRRMPAVDAWEKGYNACLDYCVAIVRQHQAKEPQDVVELLKDMCVQVTWTDRATMPIPLYIRMKKAIAAMGECRDKQLDMGNPSSPASDNASEMRYNEKEHGYRYAIGERAIADCFPRSADPTGIYHLDSGNLQALVHTVLEIHDQQRVLKPVIVDESQVARWLDGAFLNLGHLNMEQRRRHADAAIAVLKELSSKEAWGLKWK